MIEYEPHVELPTFASVADERVHRQQRLAATFRIFAALGLDSGTNGHVSARDPEFPDQFWTNPPGVHFAHVRVSDLLCCDGDGNTLAGDRAVDPVQHNIHAAVLAARPDVVSVAHAHGVYGRAWSTQHRLLDALTQDACAFFGDQALMAEYTGVVADPAEGKRIADALGTAKVVVLANHGILTAAASVEAAAWWFVSYDDCCRIQLLAEAARTVHSLGATQARETFGVLGAHRTGVFQFQPLYDRIVRESPDLLG